MECPNKLVLAIVAIVALSPLPASANLIVNGSFETTASGFVQNGGPDTMLFGPGPAPIPGWLAAFGTSGTTPNAWLGPTQTLLSGISASDGNWFLDLTGNVAGGLGGVSQFVPTTTGQSYRLSFDLGTDPAFGAPINISVQTGGFSTVFTSTATPGTNNWETFTYDFVGSGGSTVIKLVGILNSATPAPTYRGLDNVSVTAINPVPLPAALPLFGTGLALMGFAGWRRRRAASA